MPPGSRGSLRPPNRRRLPGDHALTDRRPRNVRERVAGDKSVAWHQDSLFGDHPRSFHLPRPGDDRIGVVDVGSNSVRLVVFEGGRRCPSMVFNEKIVCGLGAELERTGRLWPEGRARARAALRRFVALAPGLRVGALAGVATAAVREASDGAAFRDEIEAETGIRLEIARGADEARLAAQGVLFGDPAAEGLVVDLGGASMELCPVGRGRPGRGVSTPLGPQRLGDVADRDAVARQIAGTLAPLVKRFRAAGRRIYLVGGAWRAFGRAEIYRSGHPLNVLHEFTLAPDAARVTARRILNEGEGFYAAIPGLSSVRAPSLPCAALLLEGLIDAFEPEELAVSGFGLREGICFEYLPEEIRRLDPLISTCAGQERTRARSGGFGAELAGWLGDVVDATTRTEARILRAACHLVDVSWRAHPEFRTTAVIEAVTRTNVSSAGHRGRAFIAAALLCRYKGGRRALMDHALHLLLDAAEIDDAARLGALMRLGCAISGATPGLLPLVPLTLEGGVLTLRPGPGWDVLVGDEVEKRLAQAARALDTGWAVI